MTRLFKKSFFLVLLTILFVKSYGQKEVYFQVNHFLGDQTLTIGDSGTNDLGSKFTISRLDYYISSIRLHHDGGQITNIKNKYILVSNAQKVNELLGDYPIQVLDSITFSIGVDSVNNHADPTLWPAGHPLAPRFPDMHWGWAAGYRFVALEGLSGSSLQFEYQLHALGNQFYKPRTIVTKGENRNGAIVVSIDADYADAFTGINMDKIVFVHGSNKEILPLMDNFNHQIFTASPTTSSVKNVYPADLKMYPNPVSDNKITITLTEEQIVQAKLVLRDITGKEVSQILQPALSNELWIEHAGLYTIDLFQSGQLTGQGKLVKP
ncbi:MAG: T9SS type A sorting domain-containing protein [Saprospiraceae bacterium]|nr:T9SS type A sorting domain-containing protein [Saprospiraceae bacterium]